MRLAIFFMISLTLSAANALTIKIGTTPFSPPFLIASDSNNHFSGFDADLLNEICRRINAKCVYLPMTSFLGLFDSVLNDTVDLGIGGITITPERENIYLFSLPYLKSTAQYMTRYGNHIHKIEDIRGKTIGVAEGTIFQTMASNQFGSSVKIRTYDTLSQMLIALTDEDVDVVLLDGPNAVYWDANSNNTYQNVGEPITVGLGYGFLANKNCLSIVLKINQALLAMEGDGTYLRIYKTYF
jgi:arginine transport system substrate-binding protein